MQDKKYHKGHVKSDAINIAFEIVGHEGGAKLTMRHLADIIGISHTALYRHYKNKDAVLVKVAAKGFKQVMLQMAEGLKQHELSASKQLSEAAIAYIIFGLKHRQIYQLMYGKFGVKDIFANELGDLSQKMNEILKLIIQKGQAEGDFKPNDVDFLALSLWSFMHGFIELQQNAKKTYARDDIEKMVCLILSGFR